MQHLTRTIMLVSSVSLEPTMLILSTLRLFSPGMMPHPHPRICLKFTYCSGLQILEAILNHSSPQWTLSNTSPSHSNHNSKTQRHTCPLIASCGLALLVPSIEPQGFTSHDPDLCTLVQHRARQTRKVLATTPQTLRCSETPTSLWNKGRERLFACVGISTDGIIIELPGKPTICV